MRELEGELQLPAQSLQKGWKVLWCNAAFEESYNPRTVDAMARLYSPCTPTYIDAHLQYHSRMRYYEVEWHISVGYKIYTRIPNTPANTVPADLDLKKLKEDVNGGLSNMHTNNGWRSIFWATWDRMGGSNFGSRFKRVETRGCDLYPDGVLDLREALFGPLPDLQPDDKEGQVKRQEELIRTVRVVLAAVGMDYEISTKDDIPDKSPGEWESMDDEKLGHISWMTHGNTDKWFAREARQACGFQLPRDAKEKEEAEKEKKEIMEEEPEEEYSDDEFGPPGPGDCNHQ
ncbi:hypothetical protein ARMGADRAFT_1015339 [Armillaria gallica]|uniref:Uncharacterized protein n=1 Tax=Armillaria gallica TaxID=47427 RepID=A0A2H3D4Y4_ARMGA|nr:hypothetical protein ARMGADRAFT_1015339 [Armillaria gallica]